MEGWWKLPGPDRFARRIEEALTGGKQVVVWSAPGTAPGLMDEIIARLERRSHYFRSIDLTDVAEDPEEVLREALYLDPAEPFHRLAADHAAGAAILVAGLDTVQWLVWVDLLSRLERVARNEEPHRRNCLLLAAPDELSLRKVPREASIEQFSCERYAGRFDATAYASGLLAHQAPSLHNQIRTAVIAGLALWDVALAQRLVQAPQPCLDDALPVLREYACERSWDGVGDSPEIRRAAGAQSFFDGRDQTHSSWLAVRGMMHELKRRVWAAQVGVVFAALETKRSEIAVRCASADRFPFEMIVGGRTEVFEVPDDLDFGHLCSRYGSDPSVSKHLRDELHRLRKIRNRIAHLEPLSREELAL